MSGCLVGVADDDPEVVDGAEVEDGGDQVQAEVEHDSSTMQVPGGVQLLL